MSIKLQIYAIGARFEENDESALPVFYRVKRTHEAESRIPHIMVCFIFRNPIVQEHQRRGAAGEGDVPYYFKPFTST
jgi:hypothetical protein